jgi:hypothetical protein
VNTVTNKGEKEKQMDDSVSEAENERIEKLVLLNGVI